MSGELTPAELTDLADGLLTGAEWQAWLATHPAAAAEVAVAQRARQLMRQLERADFVLPGDFELRLRQRLRQETTLLDLLDLGVDGIGHFLLALLDLLFDLLPTEQPASQPAPA
jgi:hypothetical protein